MPLSITVFLTVAILTATYMAWFIFRSRSLLSQWAATQQMEIVHAELRNFRRGPFLWTSSKHQAVYYIKVRERTGKERNGWLCLGDSWVGLFSPKTEVQWENE